MWAWLLTLLGASAQEDGQAAQTAQSGWEWWAAGGGAALLSGSGGAVVVKKVLALLALEEKVNATDEAVRVANAAMVSLQGEMTALRKAIARLDTRADDAATTIVAMDARIAAAATPSDADQARRDEFVELRTNVQHLRERFAATELAVREVHGIIRDASRNA